MHLLPFWVCVGGGLVGSRAADTLGHDPRRAWLGPMALGLSWALVISGLDLGRTCCPGPQTEWPGDRQQTIFWQATPPTPYTSHPRL